MNDMKPLEDAPFETYLKILRENGRGEDADISEAFYVELLTTVKSRDGRNFTREQVMKAPFKNLLRAAEIILEEAQKELPQKPRRLPLPSGTALMGDAAERLSEEDLRRVMMMQNVLHEENKARQVVR